MAKTTANITAFLYTKLSSIKTSVYVLFLLAIVFALGQTSSFIYYALSLLLLLNLIICVYARYSWMLDGKKALDTATRLPALTFTLSSTCAHALDLTKEVMTNKLKYKLIGFTGNSISFERGIYYRWLTWSYHAAIIGCFAGFLATAFFVRDGYFTLKKGVPTEVISEEAENKGWLTAKDARSPDFRIVLDEFTTEYVEHHALDYPADIKSKLAIALGWRGFDTKKDAENLFPKDWFSKLKIERGGTVVLEKKIEVNDPLKYGGYTFYQVFFEQKLKIKAGKEVIDATAGMNTALDLKGLKSRVTLGTLRSGTLYTKNNQKKTIEPYIMLTVTEEGKIDKQKIKLQLNGTTTIDGIPITLLSFDESSVLSYRYDPGVPLLWFFGTIMFVVLTLRCFLSWSIVTISVTSAPEGSRVSIFAESRGILSGEKLTANRIHLALKNSLR